MPKTTACHPISLKKPSKCPHRCLGSKCTFLLESREAYTVKLSEILCWESDYLTPNWISELRLCSRAIMLLNVSRVVHRLCWWWSFWLWQITRRISTVAEPNNCTLSYANSCTPGYRAENFTTYLSWKFKFHKCSTAETMMPPSTTRPCTVILLHSEIPRANQTKLLQRNLRVLLAILGHFDHDQ